MAFSIRTSFGLFISEHPTDDKETWIKQFMGEFDCDREWAEFKYNQWQDDALADYTEERESKIWNAEMRQMIWAENGGYESGMARPSFNEF
jgi:hypothetical protein